LANTLNANCFLMLKTLQTRVQAFLLVSLALHFTFEVAEINGIDKEIIELAKQKDRYQKKVEMDHLIAELQIAKGRIETPSMRKLEIAKIIAEDERKATKNQAAGRQYEERLVKDSKIRLKRIINFLTSGKKNDAIYLMLLNQKKEKNGLADIQKILSYRKKQKKRII